MGRFVIEFDAARLPSIMGRLPQPGLSVAVRAVNGRLQVSPTDLTWFLACHHRTALDLEVALEGRAKPWSPADDLLDLLIDKGEEHEKRHLETLRSAFDVIEIAQTGSPTNRARATEDAMRSGADVIYQAAFMDEARIGYADFLMRTDLPSDLGDWSYDVVDTKLSRRLKVPALLQMATYGEHLRRLQGHPPTTLTVVGGDGKPRPFAFADVESYARRVTTGFDEYIKRRPPTAAEPVAACDQCRWSMTCSTGWRAADHLSFVAFLDGRQRLLLGSAGVKTMQELATVDVDDLPHDIGHATLKRLQRQAQLQIRERETGRPHYELLDAIAGLGLLSLPEPDQADLYLDFESDRWVEPDGLEYLVGVGTVSGGFTTLWAHSTQEEKRLTERLIDRILAVRRAHPGMHVYHYAPYEQAALKRLVQRYSTREYELDELLRAEVFVDLYAVVRQGMLVSKESYSIKKLEAFYWNAERRLNSDVAEAVSSVLEYERWIVDLDPKHLADVEAYNKDDVDSTRDLHRWLEQRREELCRSQGTHFPRDDTQTDQTFEANDEAVAELRLATNLDAARYPLLSGLVGWHRRESRPGWWEFFRYRDLTDDDLLRDATAIGQLTPPEFVGDVKQSRVWRYTFPPQESKLGRGDPAFDVDTRELVGTIVEMDLANGWLELKLKATTEPRVVRGLQPQGPISNDVLRKSVGATGQLTLAGEPNLATALVHRVVPMSLPKRPDESPGDALIRIGSSLNGEVLAVQGPPGTGKSHNAAKLIRTLVEQGKTVGVTALSHSVIGNLLAKVGVPALQKCTKDQWCGHDLVTSTTGNDKIKAAIDDGSYRLLGGTAWLWSREDMVGALDVLIVDEAGQFSLADAVAVARSASSIVLLGDPQQLTSPTQAEHPHGAGVSALQHLLGEHDTIPADRGIFFDTTWRMHPDINAFVSKVSYEGRLETDPSTWGQRIGGAGPWAGTGLRWAPVEHAARSTSSPEEAAVVAGIVADLLGTPWTDQRGVTRDLTERDILVVAPYNLQVRLLRDTLIKQVLLGLEIGTVDKFQGREAAVVIYSTTSSSAADAPRGIGFLYDTHRLNVAVSRARAIAIMVGSPALLDATAASPEQVKLINAYCRFVEMARVAPLPGRGHENIAVGVEAAQEQ